MSKRATQSSFHTYLDSILSSGTDVDIAQAKKDFLRQYKAAWRKNYRKQKHSFTIALTDKEEAVIAKNAQFHKRSRTAFIKEAAFAYTRLAFLVPNSQELDEIRTLLAGLYAVLEKIKIANVLPEAAAAFIVMKIAEVEETILNICEHPKLMYRDR